MSPEAPSISPINGGGTRYRKMRLPGERIRGGVFLLAYQKENRKNPTAAEERLWKMLRGKQVAGLKFRRQHGIGSYIVDFYCDECKLIIEVDGSIHALPEIAANDVVRQNSLITAGYQMLRFTNDEIFGDLHMVLKRIEQAGADSNPLS